MIKGERKACKRHCLQAKAKAKAKPKQNRSMVLFDRERKIWIQKNVYSNLKTNIKTAIITAKKTSFDYAKKVPKQPRSLSCPNPPSQISLLDTPYYHCVSLVFVIHFLCAGIPVQAKASTPARLVEAPFYCFKLPSLLILPLMRG